MATIPQKPLSTPPISTQSKPNPLHGDPKNGDPKNNDPKPKPKPDDDDDDVDTAKSSTSGKGQTTVAMPGNGPQSNMQPKPTRDDSKPAEAKGMTDITQAEMTAGREALSKVDQRTNEEHSAGKSAASRYRE